MGRQNRLKNKAKWGVIGTRGSSHVRIMAVARGRDSALSSTSIWRRRNRSGSPPRRLRLNKRLVGICKFQTESPAGSSGTWKLSLEGCGRHTWGKLNQNADTSCSESCIHRTGSQVLGPIRDTAALTQLDSLFSKSELVERIRAKEYFVPTQSVNLEALVSLESPKEF